MEFMQWRMHEGRGEGGRKIWLCSADEKQERGDVERGVDWSAGTESLILHRDINTNFHNIQTHKKRERRERAPSLISALQDREDEKEGLSSFHLSPCPSYSFEIGNIRMLWGGCQRRRCNSINDEMRNNKPATNPKKKGIEREEAKNWGRQEEK